MRFFNLGTCLLFIIMYLTKKGLKHLLPGTMILPGRKRPRPIGRYVSTAWIPGCFLAEGMLYIGAGIRTLDPTIRRLRVDAAISFQTVDVINDDSEIEHFSGKFNGGVVRPYLKWETTFSASKQVRV